MLAPTPETLANHALTDETILYKVAFTVGHADAVGRALPEGILNAGLEYLEERLTDLADGSSAVLQHGTYRDAQGCLAREASSHIWSYTSEAPPVAYLLHTASTAARLLAQHAVLLSIEKLAGSWYYVSQDLCSSPAFGQEPANNS